MSGQQTRPVPDPAGNASPPDTSTPGVSGEPTYGRDPVIYTCADCGGSGESRWGLSHCKKCHGKGEYPA